MIFEGSKFPSLSSFCQNGSFLKTKVALLTFYKIQYSSWVEKLILIFEYLQLMSQALFASSLLFESSNHRQYLYKIIIYAFKLVNPSELLSYESSDSMTLTVLVMVFCCTLSKIALFAKVIDVSIRNKKMNSWLLLLWRWIFKLQTRVLYFLFTSFWVKATMEAQERGFNPFGMRKYGVFFVSSFMLTAEASLSLTLETQLCYFLQTKSFLSSKNNQLEILTFLQKLMIQVFILSIRSDSEGLAWITGLIGIIMSTIKYYQFFALLPLYHFEALLLQGGLLATIISLDIACFVNNILRVSDYGVIGLNFVIITWVLLALLTNKISCEALQTRILSLLTHNKHPQTSEILLHKVIAAKELKRSERIPIGNKSDSRLGYLLFNQESANIKHIFGLESSDCFSENDEYLSKEKMNKIFLLYYKELLKKNPTNFIIKLHAAHRSYKNSEPYTTTIKVVSEMKEKRWSRNYVSYSLLLYEIEKSIMASNAKNEQNLDFFSYIKSKMLMDDLRSDMLKQTDFHLQVCKNVLSDISNFAEIQTSAKKISSLKTTIKRKIIKLSEILPEHHISPLLWYAEYHLVANNSITKSEKFHEIYTQRYARVQKLLKEPNLTQDNLYQDSNAFLLVSAQKTDFGKILYCSKSLTDLCGGQNLKAYQGSDILTLFPKFLRAYYDELFKQGELTGILNRVHRGYVYNKDKHLIEVDFCLKYHPFLAQGLCLNMIIRPVPVQENTDFLLLAQEGNIIGASKELLKSLKLKKNSHTPMIPIGAISEQLERVNEAFNMILESKEGVRKESSNQYSPRRTSKFSQMMEASEYDNANEIYIAFTSGEQQIQLYPYNEEGASLSRREIREPLIFSFCVQILNFGNLQIKHISLKSIKSNEQQQDSKATMRKIIESPTTLITKEEDIEEDYFLPTYTDRIQTTRYDFHTASHIPTSPNGDSPLFSKRHVKERETTLMLALPTHKTVVNTEAVPSASGLDLPLDEDGQLGNYRPLKRLKTRKISKDPSSSHNHPLKSTENAENRAYRNAILTKSSPKSFRGLCFIFYLVLVLTFGGQLIMKSISNDTMKNLQIRKDLLKESEERFYKGALIQVNGRGMVQQFAGVIEAGGVYSGIATVIKNLQIRMNDMVEANKKMLDLVYSLDKETQEQLFVQDIKIEGTYLDSEDATEQEMNTFQITDETVNAIKTLANMNTTATPTAALSIFNYLAINLVDDFLSKSKEITDILTNNVDKQKESFQYTTNLFLTLNPFLFVSIGILLVSIIWNQYRIENKNMKAFIKIPGKEVKRVADRLLQFKKDLLNEETFEKKWISKTSKTERSSSGSEEQQRISVYSKSSEVHQIRYQEFHRRYYGYVLRVIICISALVAITIWDLVITQNAIKVIYNRQSQLQFANYISNRVTVGAMTCAQLFYMNNTIRVENRYPLDSLPDLSEMMKDIQAKTPQRFLEVDGNYNPEVQKIIFENNPECKGFTPDFMLYCTALLNEGQPVNMIVVIAAYQTLLATKFQDYVSSNKTTSEEIIQADALTETPLAHFVVIAEEAHRIASIMDGSMTYKINEMHEEKKSILVVFTIGLLVVGIFIWFFLLKMIREVENDFKKVLQIFPVNLVLSSFLLKRFLQQSSRNPLLK